MNLAKQCIDYTESQIDGIIPNFAVMFPSMYHFFLAQDLMTQEYFNFLGLFRSFIQRFKVGTLHIPQPDDWDIRFGSQRYFSTKRDRGQVKNLVFDAYERLVEHVEYYREHLEEIEMSRGMIEEGIKLFYRKNDIGNIMVFFRAMDGGGSEDSMGINPNAGSIDTFENKMRLEKPPPIDPELITIPPLVPLPNITKELKKLIDKAYKLGRGKILAEIAK
jgi:hypothetical protein